MRKETIHVIANPHAASGRGKRVIRELRVRLTDWPTPVIIHETSRPGEATEWARDLPEETPSGPILVVGGDGTLHEVANGLLQRDGAEASRRPLVLLPVGTGNDFNRMLRSGDSIDDALGLLRRGSPRPFDVGRVRYSGQVRYFVNLLGVGIDVAVLQRRHRFALLPGLLQYLGALLSALLRFRPLPTTVRYLDARGTEHHLEGRTLLTAVTVGPSVGGGFRISPDARPDDGLLDLFQVERLSIGEIARILPRVVRGTQKEGRRVHMRRIRSGTIARSDQGPLTFELDGELMTAQTMSLEIDIVPGALTLLDAPESLEVTASERTGAIPGSDEVPVAGSPGEDP
ncbi:MAG: diacylglycerol kinase family lipid kinase [Gemmatimonadales bacterium]|nr:MAG: diacylglycerol kinase family lipid kinase [Gemmatimonadales bacterium]